MLGKIVALMLAFSGPALANLTPQEIRERLEVSVATYIFDSSGQHVLSGPERTMNARINPETGEWKSDTVNNYEKHFVGLRQILRVDDGGVIRLVVEEYSAMGKDRSLQNLIERKEFTISNLEPIVWKVRNIKDQNFVVRWVLSLREVRKPISVESLPLSGAKVSISDSAGYLWASDVSVNGKYVGVKTHRGMLALSYVPFPGAKELGWVEGNEMAIQVDKKYRIDLKSDTSFLPAGITAKVYAIYLPKKKTASVSSISTWDTNKEDRIQEALER